MMQLQSTYQTEQIEGEEIRGITNTRGGGTNRRGREDIESQTITNDDDGGDSGGSVDDTFADNAVSASINHRLPEIEAYLVDDDELVYDATRVSILDEAWWKRHQKFLIDGLVLALIVAVVVATVLGVTFNLQPNTDGSNCFPDGAELKIAVRAYVNQDCSNNEECDIGQTYGWPMNSWCVGNVQDMSWLFSQMDTFNENICAWDTSSATDMSRMFNGASSYNGNVSKFEWDRSVEL